MPYDKNVIDAVAARFEMLKASLPRGIEFKPEAVTFTPAFLALVTELTCAPGTSMKQGTVAENTEILKFAAHADAFLFDNMPAGNGYRRIPSENVLPGDLVLLIHEKDGKSVLMRVSVAASAYGKINGKDAYGCRCAWLTPSDRLYWEGSACDVILDGPRYAIPGWHHETWSRYHE